MIEPGMTYMFSWADLGQIITPVSYVPIMQFIGKNVFASSADVKYCRTFTWQELATTATLADSLLRKIIKPHVIKFAFPT